LAASINGNGAAVIAPANRTAIVMERTLILC